MKHKMTSAIGLLLLFCSTISSGGTTSAGLYPVNGNTADTLRVLSTPALMPLVNSWAQKYALTNPSVAIAVRSSEAATATGGNSLRFTPEENIAAGSTDWTMVIGHDAVVPVINSANPMIDEIRECGLTGSEFRSIIQGNNKILWSDLIKGGKNEPVNLFISSGDAIKSSVSKFTGNDPDQLNGMVIEKPEDILALVQKDVYSIGFIRLSDLTQKSGNKLPASIALLPVDRNGNGRLDSFESIYENPEALMRGIWIGKYPSALCGSILAVSPVKPEESNTVAFLRWIITDGSQYLSSNGIVPLAGIEKESGLAALSGAALTVAESQPASYAWIIILASVIVLVSVVIVVARKYARSKKQKIVTAPRISPSFNENVILSPNGLFFDKSHTWTFMERDGMVRFGIDDFIQHITGEITGIKMKEPGDIVRRGEKIFSIVKDGKQLDLYSPVSGTIRSLNTNLYDDASLINASPYTDGWVYLIEPRNWAREMQLMFMSDRYRQWIAGEFERLKGFLATVAFENSTCAHVIMQDGGEIAPNVLSEMEPEVWEDFQTRFIDTSR